jgi:hypothetical protein
MTLLNIAVAILLAPTAIKLTGKAVKKIRELKQRKYKKSYYTPDAFDRRAKRENVYVY